MSSKSVYHWPSHVPIPSDRANLLTVLRRLEKANIIPTILDPFGKQDSVRHVTTCKQVAD